MQQLPLLLRQLPFCRILPFSLTPLLRPLQLPLRLSSLSLPLLQQSWHPVSFLAFLRSLAVEPVPVTILSNVLITPRAVRPTPAKVMALTAPDVSAATALTAPRALSLSLSNLPLTSSTASLPLSARVFVFLSSSIACLAMIARTTRKPMRTATRQNAII